MVDWKKVLEANGKGVTVREGNRVDYLVDGKATYQAMYEAICTTFSNEPSYYIYLLGWWLDDQFPLVPHDPESTIEKLFRKASLQYGVQVRVMLWLNPLEFAGELPKMALWWDNRNSVTQIRQRDAFNNLRTGACILDVCLPTQWQSHHQKVLIVRGSKGLIGFCGGLDIARDRVQKVELHAGSPFHDVHCRIEGDAVCDLVDVFVQRWKAHPASKSIDKNPRPNGELRCLSDRTPPKNRDAKGTQSVGIARTFNSFIDGKWCAQELSIKEILISAIKAANRFIYIEDQYLFCEEAAKELQKALEHIQHLTILIPETAAVPYYQEARAKFFYELQANPYTEGKAAIFHLPHTYVHAKTWIFDDELAVIGSANCNQRGWVGDSEVMAAIFDGPSSAKEPSFAQKLRTQLWDEHLGVSKGSHRDATFSHAWDEAAKAGQVLFYKPSVPRKEAQNFPSPSEPDVNSKSQIVAYLTGYSSTPASLLNSVKGVWDNVLDPLSNALPRCR
jgi:phosphatidylserine/phosphatidylglycerophosphate/cardiolipin synthase-like enzyme